MLMRDHRRKVIEQAIYCVLVKVKQHHPDDPNVEIITAKLRKGDAERVCQEVPGAWIEKVVASKP